MSHFTGVSTEEEVARLMQLNIEPGEIVPYGRIERLSGVRHGTSRFKTVIHAWTRRVFREQKLQHASVRGVGIRFLTEKQALEKGVHDTNLTATAERRIATRMKAINRPQLLPLDQKRHQLLERFLRERDHAARISKKELAVPKPTGNGTVVRLAPRPEEQE